VSMKNQRYVFDHCRPPQPAGSKLSIQVSQSLSDPADPDRQLLSTTGPQTVALEIVGPQAELAEEDVIGRYPAPGSRETTQDFLAHIALRRRTLPWDRVGPTPGAPWLALIVVKESELLAHGPDGPVSKSTVANLASVDPATQKHLVSSGTFAPGDVVGVVLLPHATLGRLLPYAGELISLCHVKREETVVDDGSGVEQTTRIDTAIVLGNRLPDAEAVDGEPERHHAMLVSLERREDVYARIASKVGGLAALVVLDHWTFTPSGGGDFEHVVRAIGVRPNGGVLRFGNLPRDAPAGKPAPLSGGFDAVLDAAGFPLQPVAHAVPSAVYRGPLRPVPAAEGRGDGFAVRAAPQEFVGAEPGDPLDHSHAAAFELGRLLALNDPGIQDDLHTLRRRPVVIKPQALEKDIPASLRRYDWVSNPEFAFEDPWSVAGESLIKTNSALLKLGGIADVSGVAEQEAFDGGVIGEELEGFETPVLQTELELDVDTIDTFELDKTFVIVKNAGG